MNHNALKTKSLIYYLTFPFIIIFIFFVANRNPGFPDYNMYLAIFNNVDYRSDIEFTYIYIVKLVHYFNGDILDVMLLYSTIGLYVKSKVIFRETSQDGSVFYYYVFLVAYCFSFLFMWECIQMRAAAGISFYLLGCYSKNNKSKLLFFLISCAFHYSMILPCALYLCFFIIKSLKYRLIAIPLIMLAAMVIFYLTPYSKTYSASNFSISGKGIFSTQYCLVYLNLALIVFFYRAINISRDESVRIYFSAVLITLIMVAFNKSFPAMTDRLMDIATFLSFIPLFFIRCKGYKLFLLVYACFFSLMRFRVISSDLGPQVMNMSYFFIR